jgi:hypothetical protein
LNSGFRAGTDLPAQHQSGHRGIPNAQAMDARGNFARNTSVINVLPLWVVVISLGRVVRKWKNCIRKRFPVQGVMTILRRLALPDISSRLTAAIDPPDVAVRSVNQ